MEDQQHPRGNPADAQSGHHIGDDRNVIPTQTPSSGNDIFRAAVQMTRMPMVLLGPDLHKFPIVFANKAFESLTGYDEDEIASMSGWDFHGDSPDHKTVQEIKDRLGAGLDVQVEVLNYRKDGTSFWNALFVSPVKDTAGALQYYFASEIDVTRRREAEAVLCQSQRMESLGSMAAGLAHEQNNLMQISLSSLEVVRVQQNLSPERRTILIERAEWASKTSQALTRQTLNFVRRRFGEHDAFDVSKALCDFEGILSGLVGSAATIEVKVGDGPLIADLDHGQLEIALINLVKNAVDAMRGNGMIRVTTCQIAAGADLEADGAITAEIEEHSPPPSPDRARFVEVAVSDNGSGMEADVAKRATEPFYTTKPEGQGTGLGLSMVRRFVEESRGKLLIETKPGNGTTIRMLFPLKIASG